MGKLLEQLKDTNTKQKALLCSLKSSCQFCSGRGFRLLTRGAYTCAEVCSCVQSCSACFGKAQILDGKIASPCKTPSPVKLCGLINNAQIPARYTNACLSDFTNTNGNGKEILLKLRAWLNHFKTKEDQGFIISGPVGVGKTLILAAITKALIARGFKTQFIDFFQLISQIKACYANKQSEQTLIAPLIDVDVLIIDELGKGRNTEFELTILDQLIMGRYNQNKAIVASTNCSIQAKKETLTKNFYEIPLDQKSESQQSSMLDFGTLEDRVGSRIYSRLMETTISFELTGNDYRKQKGSSWTVH